MTTLPQHLGGHENETHIDDGALSYFIENFGVKSMVDIGCGPGGMVDLARRKGLDIIGLDGDYSIERPSEINDLIKIHDFVTGPYQLDKTYDLAWTVEFVEHVEEKYMDNFIDVMKQCKFVIMTHAFPDNRAIIMLTVSMQHTGSGRWRSVDFNTIVSLQWPYAMSQQCVNVILDNRVYSS